MSMKTENECIGMTHPKPLTVVVKQLFMMGKRHKIVTNTVDDAQC